MTLWRWKPVLEAGIMPLSAYPHAARPFRLQIEGYPLNPESGPGRTIQFMAFPFNRSYS